MKFKHTIGFTLVYSTVMIGLYEVGYRLAWHQWAPWN